MKKKFDVLEFRIEDQLSLPTWYSWQRHLILHLLFFSISLLIGLFWAQTIELIWSFLNIAILVGLIFVWANLEYLIHRFILHGSFPLLTDLTREHSYNHHHYFIDKAMYAQKNLDLNRILLMPIHLLGVLVLNGILSQGISLIINERIGLLFYFAGILYAFLYEMVHGLAHWNLSAKISLLKTVVSHHRQHHNLKEMNSKNFAVIFPIIDFIWGTQVKKSIKIEDNSNAPS